jgi:hypothetical protein
VRSKKAAGDGGHYKDAAGDGGHYKDAAGDGGHYIFGVTRRG